MKKSKKKIRIKSRYGMHIQYEEGDYFEVEKIISKRVDPTTQEIFYLVKWEGWPSSYNSWEPIHHLKNIWRLVMKFEREECHTEEEEITKIESILLTEDEPEMNMPLGGLSVNILNDLEIMSSSELIGNLEDDIPYRIVRMEKEQSGEILAEIEWMLRINGYKPRNSKINRDLLKQNYIQLLIEFYESRFRFLNT